MPTNFDAAHGRDRRAMREPRPRAQRPVERPIRSGVPVADGAHNLGLEPLGHLEELDQLIATDPTRPGAAVLRSQGLDCEADLLDRVITEHVFDTTRGVRQLRVTNHLVVDGRDQPVGEQAATPHLVVMSDRERGVGQRAGEQLADREATKRDEDRVREI